MKNNLYIIQQSQSDSLNRSSNHQHAGAALSTTVNNKDDDERSPPMHLTTWHERLGHASDGVMALIKDVVDGGEELCIRHYKHNHKEHKSCVACLLSKTHRQPFAEYHRPHLQPRQEKCL